MSAITTFAPASASAVAMPRPMPEAAPVTMAVLPEISIHEVPFVDLIPLVGRAGSRGSEHHPADDITKCRVVIDATDAPSVIGALPAHPPFSHPPRQSLVPVEPTHDNCLASARWRWLAREMTDARTPSEKLRIARDAHIHAELLGRGGKRTPLLLARRNFGAQHIGRRLSAMDQQDRHDDRALAAPRFIAKLRQ